MSEEAQGTTETSAVDTLTSASEPTTPTGGDTPAPVEQSTPEKWSLAFEDEGQQAWFNNKGFKDPETALKSYYHLEKLHGAVKSGNAISMPQEGADQAEWDHFYNKMGRPHDHKEYSFLTKDNMEELGWVAEVMHKNGVPNDAATAIMEAYAERATTTINQQQEEKISAVEADMAALKQEWGAQHDQNIAKARAAVREFGLDEATINNLEGALGYGDLMRFLSNVGRKVGQDTYESGQSDLMDPRSAKQQLDELSLDKNFMEAFMNSGHVGHKAAVAKKARLAKMVAGVNPDAF